MRADPNLIAFIWGGSVLLALWIGHHFFPRKD
jgi:hypothetical protein